MGVQIIWVRHGQSQVNYEKKVPGQSLNSALTDEGIVHARHAARLCSRMGKVDTLYASDALRARQTAQIIAEQLSMPIYLNPLLREQSFGSLEGTPVDALCEQQVPEGADIADIAWGGGESVADVYRRLVRFASLLEKSVQDRIIIVAHADAYRIFKAVLEHRSHRDVDWNESGLDYGQIAQITYPHRKEQMRKGR